MYGWAHVPSCKHVFAPRCTRNGCVDGTKQLRFLLYAPDGEEAGRSTARLRNNVCPLSSVVESVVEHMKKPLLKCTVNSPSTTHEPMHHVWERFACKSTASQEQHETFVGEMELRSVCSCALRSSAQGSRRNYSAPQAASEHCTASCATCACAKILTTNGRASGILHRYAVYYLLCVRCCLYVGCWLLLVVVALSCVVRGRVCYLCVVTRVVRVASALFIIIPHHPQTHTPLKKKEKEKQN